MRQVTIITNAEMVRLIRRRLKQEGLTMASQARLIGVNYQHFHDMLAGRTPITKEVARYFNFERLDRVFAARQPRDGHGARAKRTGRLRSDVDE